MCLLLFCFGDAAQRPLPRKLCLPVDHASDNGGRAAVLGLKLVMHGYFERVTACFLVVGHAHIDVDVDVLMRHAFKPATNCAALCSSRALLGRVGRARMASRVRALRLLETGDAIRCFKLSMGRAGMRATAGDRAVVLQEVSRGGEKCA